VAGWQTPDPPAPVHWTRSGAPASEEPEITYEWVGDTLRHVGTAVHTFLARIARGGPAQSDNARIRAVLRNLGVTEPDIDAASAQVSEALDRASTSARGRWILLNRAESACELALSGVSEGEIYDVVIDRTFVDGDGTRWIVDYKTGTHTGGKLDEFLSSEKERYRPQLERYARLLAQQDSRPVRLGLYFPLIENGWVEWDAPAAAPSQASLFA
jgi:ATP-dependent exoDNAse (exonuclease V) beta subunit